MTVPAILIASISLSIRTLVRASINHDSERTVKLSMVVLDTVPHGIANQGAVDMVVVITARYLDRIRRPRLSALNIDVDAQDVKVRASAAVVSAQAANAVLADQRYNFAGAHCWNLSNA